MSRPARAAALAALAALALAFAPSIARAQCGAKSSSCHDCHGSARAPFVESSPWHRDHAFADLCASCHGGEPEAASAQAAHAGVVDPLEAPAERCGSCHANARELAARYPPPTPANGAAPPLPPAARPASSANVALAVVALGIAGVAAALVARARIRTLARSAWSPYAGGVALGVVVTISMALFGRRLSGAGAYQQVAGGIGRAVAPSSVYFKHIVPSGLTWDLVLVVGAALGALVAALLSGDFRLRTMPDRGWTEAFGPSVARRWGLAFAGSMLTEIGAGIAGGCTASLAVSGGAALAPSAFLFMAGMFAGGIPTALLIHKKGRAP